MFFFPKKKKFLKIDMTNSASYQTTLIKIISGFLAHLIFKIRQRHWSLVHTMCDMSSWYFYSFVLTHPKRRLVVYLYIQRRLIKCHKVYYAGLARRQPEFRLANLTAKYIYSSCAIFRAVSAIPFAFLSIL